jgi:hypothetical protein
MRTIAALMLLTLALAGAAPAQAADTTVATVVKPTKVDAYGGRAVWSAWDPAAGAYRLTERSAGAVRAVPVAPGKVPFDVDLGPGPHGGTIAVYTRCSHPTAFVVSLNGRKGCDLYAYRFSTRKEVALTRANSPGADEYWPTVWGGRLAFTRTYRPKGGLPRRFVYWRSLNGGGASHRMRPARPRLEYDPAQELDMRGDRVAFDAVHENGHSLWVTTIGGGARRLVRTPGSGAETHHLGVQGPTLAGGLVHWGFTRTQEPPVFTELRTVDITTRRNRRATTRVDGDAALIQPATTGVAYDNGAVWYVRTVADDAYEVHVATGLTYEPVAPPHL